jgi:hypothetical protein
MRAILVALICLFAVNANAQTASYPPGPSQADMLSAINALQAQIPTPATSAPSAGSLAGAAGSATTYARSDFQIPITVQRTTTTTDASGNLSVTWNKAFTSSTPTALLVPVNAAGTQPIVCNVKTRSQTGVTGYCWQSNTLTISLAALPLVGNLFPIGAATVPVMVIGAEPTQ